MTGPPLDDLAGARFLRAQQTFRHSAFRLETRQSYAGSGEDEALAAFRYGETQPALSQDDRSYLHAVAAARKRGARWQRVHVVMEPLSEYLQFELTWEYGPNAQAGEEIGIVAVPADEPWPLTWDVADFWLFDEARLFVPVYDQYGTWLGMNDVDDADRVRAACRAKTRAIESATSWHKYVAERPELAERVPTDVEWS